MSKIINIANNTKDKGFFKAFIPMAEVNGKINVLEKMTGEGAKQKFLVGIATNTQIDKENERMTNSFIGKVRNQAKGLNVFAEHKHSIEKTIGYIEDVGGGDDNLEIVVALENEEDNPLVKSILNKINHGIKIGFSIGGKILKAKKVFDTSVQKWINEIEDGEIYEVSVTAIPAGNGTLASVIQKSMAELFDDESVKNQIDKISKDEANETMVSIQKALDEIIQSNELKNKLFDFFYAFRSSVYNIIESDLDPADKKTAIMKISEEFAGKVEEISNSIADAAVALQEQLGQYEAEGLV